MVWCYLKGGDGPDGHYAPTYCPETGKVDVVWIEEAAPSAAQIAQWAAERERLDPIIEDQLELDLDNPVSDGRPA